jgi:protein tyrosine/serine phosphatase
MLKKNYLLAMLSLLLFMFTGCMKDKDDNKVITPTSAFTSQEKLQGYKIDTVENVKFVMTEELFKTQLSTEAEITAVNVAGSFNGWNATSTDWKMVKSTTEDVWTVEKTPSLVKIPGNSGHPEFKFVITTKEADGTTKTSQWMQPLTGLQDGYKFKQNLTNSNTLVIFADDNLNEIIADETQAMTIKTTESAFTTVEQMTNFRNVKTGNIGDKKLFRTYHPFIASRAADADLKEIEAIKISKMEELMAANGIKSIINLSEKEPGSAEGRTTLIKDSITGEYYLTANLVKYIAKTTYKNAIDSNNVLFYETSYNTVYYESTTDDYAKLMKAVCDFVRTHDAPYMVHCRLGTDRTGAVIGFFEALMGATWGEIATDYSKSNEQGFREFRSSRILKYSFEKLLGTTLTDSSKLDTGIINFLKTNENIKYTDEQIAEIKAKLAN